MKYNFNQLVELSKINSSEFVVNDISSAYLFCEKLSKSHYENFPVGSLLIPKKIRKHFYSIYAYSRLADDIADENLETNPEDRYNLLELLETNLDADLLSVQTPILKAVLNTVEETKVELSDLKRLIIAFKMDIRFEHPKNFSDLFHYCYYSANPIGEMMLKLFDEATEDNVRLSDDICTALQLVNFWQDISKDKDNGRYYIPEELLLKFGLNYNNLSYNKVRLQVLLDSLYQETEKLFDNGKKLCYLVKNKRLKLELSLIISSGIRILEKCKNLKTEIIDTRPKLIKADLLPIVYNAFRL